MATPGSCVPGWSVESGGFDYQGPQHGMVEDDWQHLSSGRTWEKGQKNKFVENSGDLGVGQDGGVACMASHGG